MRRREFLAMACGLATQPIVARAQTTAGGPLIGVLTPQSAASAVRQYNALRAALRDLGHVEGRNLRLTFRNADGDLSKLPALAAELVGLKPDLIIAGSTPATLAVRDATRTIPVVMVTLVDPVELGIVNSLARPGGNITGIWTFGGGDVLIGKRITLLKEIVPALPRIGAMIASDASDEIVARLMPAAAQALGMEFNIYRVGTTAELDRAFGQATSDGMKGLFVHQSPFFLSRRTELAAMAARERLPAVYGYREHAEAGGLMSYGSSLSGAYVQVARLIDKVLRGAKPGDLPVEQADKFELVINLKTAKSLGLTVPNSMQLLADDVIE
jgi:putative tryptophan/tyrosine transport system substrate-binding protein